MHIATSLFNRPELIVLDELRRIGKDNNFNIHSKTRLSDVVLKGKSSLTQREFDYYTRAHCDFVVTDATHKPKMIVEYDGPFHKNPVQLERDKIKNELCKRAGLGILRVDDRHVSRLYRGMTLLRWIVEVQELQGIFYDNQEAGRIPHDEPFDPCAFTSSACNRNSKSGEYPIKYPYWLSASYIQQFHAFLRKLGTNSPKGWSGISGDDQEGNSHRLSWLYFNKEIIWSKTSIRNQDIDFPHHDLLSEIDICELGMCLTEFLRGNVQAVPVSEFRSIFERFCYKFSAYPSYSSGAYPFRAEYDFADGHWNFEA